MAHGLFVSCRVAERDKIPSAMTTSALPLLIVVTGRPGAGKTALAHALARAIRCPAICRDEIKEGLINTAGEAGGDDVARHAYEAFFDTVTLLIERRVTLVAEAAFQHKLWAPKFELLRASAHIRIIVCDIAPEIARHRRAARAAGDPARARFHPDVAPGPAGDEYEPPHFDVPTLTVDTSDGYRPELDQIISFVRG
jgi:predicted kinase